jgi:hypothetical protein
LKKVTTLVLVLLSGSTIAQTTDLYKSQNQNRLQITKLNKMLADHFSQYGQADPDEFLTLESLKNKARQRQMYQLNRILGLAIDEDRPLQDLEFLGVSLTEKGNYQVNLNQNPRWATLPDLAIPLSGKLHPIVATDLKTRGFREKDLDRLRRHLDDNPQDVAALQAQSNFISKKSKPFFAKLKLKTQGLGDSVGLLKQYNKVRVEAERQWLLAVFDLYDVQRQRILLAYLQERLGIKIIAKAPLTEQGVTDFASRFVSGKQMEQVQFMLNSRTQESNQ